MNRIQKELSELDKKGFRRKLRKNIHISAREYILDGRHCIDFSSNNYMGNTEDALLLWTKNYSRK